MSRIVLSRARGLLVLSCHHLAAEESRLAEVVTKLRLSCERQAWIERKGCFIQEASSLGESTLVSKNLSQRFCLAMQVALVVKNLPASAGDSRDTSLISGPGRSPRGEIWQPTPGFLPEKPHGPRSLLGCSPWGGKELDMTEHLSTNIWKFL